VLIAADSASGISSVLDYTKWVFVNPDLTVYMTRLPQGEWVCLDATTTPDPVDVGITASIIFDEAGKIGRGLQSLFIAPRPTP
jgi:hypothetical protein